MDEQLVERVRKNEEIMDQVFENVKVIKISKSAEELMDSARRYYEDAKYFASKGDYTSSLEAFAISWAYIDSGLKVGVFSVPAEMSIYFTI